MTQLPHFRNASLRIVALLMCVFHPGTTVGAQQVVDSAFKATVARPAYTTTSPFVVIDEAHSNFHTSTGRYKPFADMLRSDGYTVAPGTRKFARESLNGVDVLVISNARASDATAHVSKPAFTDRECKVVRDWVAGGGSLLLIADHAPYGGAAANLAKLFGVKMGAGYLFDFSNSMADSPSALIFSRANGLLGNHPLIEGRDSAEAVKTVVSFTGQSLSIPKGATALLKLSPTAYESPTQKEYAAAVSMDQLKHVERADSIKAHSRPAAGRAQGIAMNFGKGRVVIVGEAAMFSAQIIRFTLSGEEKEFRMGMNVPGNDDRQFALNVLHWLSRLLN